MVSYRNHLPEIMGVFDGIPNETTLTEVNAARAPDVIVDHYGIMHRQSDDISGVFKWRPLLDSFHRRDHPVPNSAWMRPHTTCFQKRERALSASTRSSGGRASRA